MAEPETDYEKRQREAAATGDFDTWRKAREEQNQLGDTINGRPAADVIGSPEQVTANNPVLPAPNSPVSNPAQVMAAAEQIGAQTAQAQGDYKSLDRERYNAFLADQGVNPNTIGTATLRGPMTARSLAVPTGKELAMADKGIAAQQAAEAQMRIGANDLKQKGRGDLAADLLNNIQTEGLARGGNSYEVMRQHWLQRLNNAYAARANGFAQ